MLLVLVLLGGPVRADEPVPALGDPGRGAVVAGLAGCASCHTAPGGEPYAGGYALETAYGVFHGPNITPDPEHGIGAWSWTDFVDALRRGRSPKGQHYYPAFPYAAYTGMRDQDLVDLWAYLQTVPPVARPDEPHALTRYRKRGALAFWKLLELDKGALPVDPEVDPQLDRGRYLVEAVGHCGECHTPRNGIGGLRDRHALAGHDAPPEPGPNITPHADGLADWSLDDWETFLELGMLPDGDFVGGEMLRLVEQGTSQLSAEDRRAVARWMIEGVQPRPDP